MNGILINKVMNHVEILKPLITTLSLPLSFPFPFPPLFACLLSLPLLLNKKYNEWHISE